MWNCNNEASRYDTKTFIIICGGRPLAYWLVSHTLDISIRYLHVF